MTTHTETHPQRLSAQRSAHPTMTLDIEGVTIAVRFDRFDMDQAQYEWEVSCQNVTDHGEMRGAGGEPIALDGAITQIIDAMRDQPAAFPLMEAANLDLAYIASQAAHYLPTAP